MWVLPALIWVAVTLVGLLWAVAPLTDPEPDPNLFTRVVAASRRVAATSVAIAFAASVLLRPAPAGVSNGGYIVAGVIGAIALVGVIGAALLNPDPMSTPTSAIVLMWIAVAVLAGLAVGLPGTIEAYETTPLNSRNAQSLALDVLTRGWFAAAGVGAIGVWHVNRRRRRNLTARYRADARRSRQAHQYRRAQQRSRTGR